MSWPLVKLTEVAEVNPRCPKDIDEDQIVSFVAMASASEAGLLLGEELRVLKDTKKGFTYFERGDVLLAKITPCFENGKTLRPYQIKNQVGFGSTEFHVVRADLEKLDPTYLFYLLWSDAFRFLGTNAMAGAAGQKRVGTPFLKQLEIPLPPLDEQKRIAAILDKADAIRQKRKQAIDLADEFLRSVFLDMFGDPVTNPKGWEVKVCKDLFKRVTVGIVVKPSSYYVESGVPALRSLNIGCYGIRPENLVYVSKSDNESRLSKTRVYEGDLVIVRSGQPGKTAVVCKEFDGVNAIDILIATPKEELIDQQFFAFFMNSEGGKKIVLAEQRGQVQKHFNVGSLNSTGIPLPPLSLQRTFAEIVATVYGKYQTNKVTEFNEVFNSLSQKAFSGQL
ncbi:TPA: restriction endonuclease [Vibrio vulnificus]|nr:restriction endonuclease [Vibrio vulnificus]HDY8137329.1 restriction endonuclease subunit S [Vibrio vulnificus]HDY8216274.1 restriction endonuclease subunit S [Vibrio vulnificus]